MANYQKYRSNEVWIFHGEGLSLPFQRHRAVEFMFFEKGSAKVTVEGKSHELQVGDVAVIYPNQLHSYSSAADISCYSILFPEDLYSRWTEKIKDRKPVNPIVRGGYNEEFRNLFENQMLYTSPGYTPARRRAATERLCALLLADLPTETINRDDRSLDRIFRYCEEHFTENINLNTISKELFLDKYYISHLLNDLAGTSLRGYINILRVEKASKLLSSSELSIAEICSACGFQCMRTFDRVFREQNELTPKDYRKAKIQEKDLTKAPQNRD